MKIDHLALVACGFIVGFWSCYFLFIYLPG